MGDEEGNKIGLLERAKGFFKKKAITPSDKVDEHLTKNLAGYVDEYKLATKSDLNGIDKKIEGFMAEISDLNDWKETTEERVHRDRAIIEEMEEKLGIDFDAEEIKEGS